MEYHKIQTNKVSEFLHFLLVDYSLHQQLSGTWRTTSVPGLHFHVQCGSAAAAPEIAAEAWGGTMQGGALPHHLLQILGLGLRGVVRASSGGWIQDRINTIKGNYEMADQFLTEHKLSITAGAGSHARRSWESTVRLLIIQQGSTAILNYSGALISCSCFFDKCMPYGKNYTKKVVSSKRLDGLKMGLPRC